MAKTDFKTIDDYLASMGPEQRKALEQVRAAIRETVPEAKEAISYQIPAFEYHGWLWYFSGYASHFSLSHPPPVTEYEAFKDELARYKKSKSTIQFPLDEPVPVDLIKRMARHRAEENERTAAAKKH